MRRGLGDETWSVIDDERDPARLVVGLLHVADTLRRFFGRSGLEWGRELLDPAIRDAVAHDIEVAEAIVAALKPIPAQIASYVLTPDEFRSNLDAEYTESLATVVAKPKNDLAELHAAVPM